MRARLALVCSLVSLGLLLPADVAVPAAAEEGTHSPNMQYVKQVPFGKTRPAAMENGGTDIEFATLDVVKRDANGNPLCVTKLVKNRKGNKKLRCQKDARGSVVWQREAREFAFAGTYDNGLQILDITNPEQTSLVGRYDCAVRQGDVQVFTRGDRTYATYTQDDPYNATPRHDLNSQCYSEARSLGLFRDGMNPAGTFIVDVTDPARPATVSFFSEPRGSHNLTVAPGGDYAYNSNSDLNQKNPQIEVWDIRDFDAPKSVFTLNTTTGLSSHDVTFNSDGTRAYSAAVTHTLVLDTTNLAEPRIIGRIADPAVNIHHQSDPVTIGGKTFLIVSDEFAGAAGNGTCPGGGLHVYDITGSLERTPVKVGVWNSPATFPVNDTHNLTCTAHVFRVYPEQRLMTIAWYEAGVRVVDISNLVGVAAGVSEGQGNLGMGMREIGYYRFPDSDTWSVKTNRIEPDGSFYLFGNDQARGLDVYRFNAAAPRAAESGMWLTPEQAVGRAGGGEVPATGPSCLYRGLQVA